MRPILRRFRRVLPDENEQVFEGGGVVSSGGKPPSPIQGSRAVPPVRGGAFAPIAGCELEPI